MNESPDMGCRETLTLHRRTTVSELGYERAVCAECETTWPCRDEVMARCQRNYLDHGMPCDCGWHEEKVVEDPEQEKRVGQFRNPANGWRKDADFDD